MHAFLAIPNLRFLPIPCPNFGAAIKQRRLQLGLNCSRAASATGIQKDEWQHIEAGWVPAGNENFLRSLAGTLEIKYEDLVCALSPLVAHFDSAVS